MAMDPFTSKPNIPWSDGKAFAFTIFDDPDFQTVQRGAPVYSLLADLGFHTTRGVFPGTTATPTQDRIFTCHDPQHLEWLQSLQDGKLHPEFRRLMERLSRKHGWFVPVSTLLDHIGRHRGPVTINPEQRRILERRWLTHKIRFGTA